MVNVRFSGEYTGQVIRLSKFWKSMARRCNPEACWLLGSGECTPKCFNLGVEGASYSFSGYPTPWDVHAGTYSNWMSYNPIYK